MVQLATVLGNAREGIEARIWRKYAYVARYGMQPMSEMRRMRLCDLDRLSSELSAIVKDENEPKRRD